MKVFASDTDSDNQVEPADPPLGPGAGRISKQRGRNLLAELTILPLVPRLDTSHQMPVGHLNYGKSQ